MKYRLSLPVRQGTSARRSQGRQAGRQASKQAGWQGAVELAGEARGTGRREGVQEGGRERRWVVRERGRWYEHCIGELTVLPPRARSLALYTNPTPPLNYHRPPPPLRPSRSALSLSLSLSFSILSSLPLFLPSRLPPYPSFTATPSNPLPSFQLHPSLSLYYMYARMYICTSFCLAPFTPRPLPTALARRLTTLTPLTTTFVFACPAHVPDRLPSNPLSGTGVYSRGVRSRYCPDRGMQRLEDARIHT